MREIFDDEFPGEPTESDFSDITNLIIENRPSDSIVEKARGLYRYLPSSEREVKELRKNTRDCILWSYRGESRGGDATRRALHPYKEEMWSLLLAINIRLANHLTNPNQNNWDERVCNLFLEIQKNLSSVRPLYFASMTFSRNLTFEQVRENLKAFRNNTLRREGFRSVGLVAFHYVSEEKWRRRRYRGNPSKPREQRLHCHLLFWPEDGRNRADICRGLKKLRWALDRGRHGFGWYRFSKIKNILDFMKRARYMAINYSESLKYQRGNDWNPIPKRSKLLSLPKNEHGNMRWLRVEDDRISTSKRAWEKAVEKYADMMGYDYRGYWIKMYADRIKELIEPEDWQEPTVSGLDGFDYQITPINPGLEEGQRYMLSNPVRPDVIITEEELKLLGGLEIYPGALPRNPEFHPVQGEPLPHTRQETTAGTTRIGKLLIGIIGIAFIGFAFWQLFKRKR